MFNSNQRLMNRWRLDHKLPPLDRIERWVVWDLQDEKQLELLTPTPTENIHVQQPQFFMDVHQNNPDCTHCDQENGQAFAIYEFGTSELIESAPISPKQLHTFTTSIHALLENHGEVIYPQEIVVYDDGHGMVKVASYHLQPIIMRTIHIFIILLEMVAQSYFHLKMVEAMEIMVDL